MSTDTDEHIVLGRISGLYGVRGWVKVFSYTQPRDNILTYPTWYVNRKPVQLAQGKVHGKGIIAQLAGIDDRDVAATFIQQEISVPRSDLARLSAGEYYWMDLIGMQVQTLQGDVLGTVDHLFETGANDVLVVKGDRERLLPWVPDQVICEVDLVQRLIRVDWEPDF